MQSIFFVDMFEYRKNYKILFYNESYKEMTHYGLYINFTHTSVVVVLSELHVLYNDVLIHTKVCHSITNTYRESMSLDIF